MTTSGNPQFNSYLAHLTELGDTSVWSLIVTVMGDMVAEPNQKISGPTLAKILEPIGVRPEALRVALHRLRKDDWIGSEKRGRTSLHRLTTKGLIETRDAAKRIYQRQVEHSADWYLLWGQPETDNSPPADTLQLGRRLYLGKGQSPDLENYLVMQGSVPQLPSWLQTRLGWDELATSYAALAQALQCVADSLQPLSPMQAATLRTLIVHHWRRNLLKHPDLPLELFPVGWQGETCRRQAMSLLDQLPKPDLPINQ